MAGTRIGIPAIAKLLKRDNHGLVEWLQKQGIGWTAASKMGKGYAYQYDRADIDALVKKLKPVAAPPAPAAPAPAPAPVLVLRDEEILRRLESLEGLTRATALAVNLLLREFSPTPTPATNGKGYHVDTHAG